jgi:hypothetical protein
MTNTEITVIYVHLDYTSYSFSKDFFSHNHVYSKFPKYGETSINQSKKYYSNIVLLTSDDYKDEIEKLYSICKQCYPSFCSDPFWFFTLARLFSVGFYIKHNNIDKFIHLEYDNLIYSDAQVFSNLPSNIYFTKVGPKIGSAGFIFGNNLLKSCHFFEKLFELIIQGEKFLSNKLSSTHLYEMEMIDYLFNKNYCKYLPLFIEDEYFKECGVVFDGASYGQYLGGTNSGDPSGWFGLHHFVGDRLSKRQINIRFNKKPYLVYENNEYLIYNLHIHNKKVINNFI